MLRGAREATWDPGAAGGVRWVRKRSVGTGRGTQSRSRPGLGAPSWPPACSAYRPSSATLFGAGSNEVRRPETGPLRSSGSRHLLLTLWLPPSLHMGPLV